MNKSNIQNVDSTMLFRNFGIQLGYNTSGDAPLNLLQLCTEQWTTKNWGCACYLLASNIRIQWTVLIRHIRDCIMIVMFWENINEFDFKYYFSSFKKMCACACINLQSACSYSVHQFSNQGKKFLQLTSKPLKDNIMEMLTPS